MMKITAYILAKNEEVNIKRCLASVNRAGVPAVVLDSGSTDKTIEIARAMGATVEPYQFVVHFNALDEVVRLRTPENELCMLLDSDFEISRELVDEAREMIESGKYNVVAAPIVMHWEAEPLKYASLYPPKPFMYRGGRNDFTPAGHDHMLKPGVPLGRTKNVIHHDDRKPFSMYVLSQVRYSHHFLNRVHQGQASLRDKIRRISPLLTVAVPLISWLFKGGFMDGKAGIGYAMDRMIAEAVMYRQSLAHDIAQEQTKKSQAAASGKGLA